MNSLTTAQSAAHTATMYDDSGMGVLGVLLAGMGVASWLVIVALYVLVAIGLWKMFAKAGLPGILGIIPIVNLVFLLKIARLNMWLALLYLVPIANIVLAIIVALKVGRNFGHGAAFSVFLLWLFPVIGYLIVGFGGDQYRPVEPRPAY
ncbi:DUF5684 domain-containing protein [Microbacterium halophytorum]|uniref:DUF5684 domain-containing protein n=1 Tax=Microbacterium halophytorum TaxID=2067568 RepID=UPI001E387648|nr:DUF5684 domain-containing protein [Microbacterium halophytorum]